MSISGVKHFSERRPRSSIVRLRKIISRLGRSKESDSKKPKKGKKIKNLTYSRLKVLVELEG